MASAIRYTLAAMCFTASIVCLALWWRGMTERLFAQVNGLTFEFTVEARDGYLITYNLPGATVASPFVSDGPWWSEPQDGLWSDSLRSNIDRMGRFAAFKLCGRRPLSRK